jgi:hypothetical protein
MLLLHVVQQRSLFNVECDVRILMDRKLGMEETHAKRRMLLQKIENLFVDEFSFCCAAVDGPRHPGVQQLPVSDSLSPDTPRPYDGWPDKYAKGPTVLLMPCSQV